jgi:hypothetical protein
MRGSSFAAKIVAGLIAITLAVPPSLAADGKLRSWQNLEQLRAGQEIEVARTNGEAVRGTFVAVADQSIRLRAKEKDIAITRGEVSRVQLRPAGNRRHAGWIGAGIGAGAGAGVGAGIAEGFSTDFSNLRPAIIGVSAGIGALVGAAIGSVIGGRHTTIYRAK